MKVKKLVHFLLTFFTAVHWLIESPKTFFKATVFQRKKYQLEREEIYFFGTSRGSILPYPTFSGGYPISDAETIFLPGLGLSILFLVPALAFGFKIFLLAALAAVVVWIFIIYLLTKVQYGSP